jgi:hypothetical protein
MAPFTSNWRDTPNRTPGISRLKRLRLGPPSLVVLTARSRRRVHSRDRENGAVGGGLAGTSAVARDPAVVTAAEVVAGHVGLDISCLDRVYLNG